MKKFEYAKILSEIAIRDLNELGDEGWELVCRVPVWEKKRSVSFSPQLEQKSYLIFKRPKPQ